MKEGGEASAIQWRAAPYWRSFLLREGGEREACLTLLGYSIYSGVKQWYDCWSAAWGVSTRNGRDVKHTNLERSGIGRTPNNLCVYVEKANMPVWREANDIVFLLTRREHPNQPIGIIILCNCGHYQYVGKTMYQWKIIHIIIKLLWYWWTSYSIPPDFRHVSIIMYSGMLW